MAQIYEIISWVSFILAGVFLIVSVILFFLLKIRKTIDFLSGKEAERTMERIRNEVKEGNKKATSNKYEFNDVRVNVSTEHITEELNHDESVNGTVVLGAMPELEPATTVLTEDEEATTVLGEVFVILENITLCQSKEIIKVRAGRKGIYFV